MWFELKSGFFWFSQLLLNNVKCKHESGAFWLSLSNGWWREIIHLSNAILPEGFDDLNDFTLNDLGHTYEMFHLLLHFSGKVDWKTNQCSHCSWPSHSLILPFSYFNGGSFKSMCKQILHFWIYFVILNMTCWKMYHNKYPFSNILRNSKRKGKL